MLLTRFSVYLNCIRWLKRGEVEDIEADKKTEKCYKVIKLFGALFVSAFRANLKINTPHPLL